MQASCQEGQPVEEATWRSVALILKGGVYFRGIGLVEVMWKVVAVILNCYFRASTAVYVVFRGF